MLLVLFYILLNITNPTKPCPINMTEKLREVEYIIDAVETRLNKEGQLLTEDAEDYLRQTLTADREAVVRETEKAFGGCKKCYGKGYSTVIDSTTCHADFIGDKTYSKTNNPVRFCSCDRGIQLQALTTNNPN